jgi:serine/threonine-protein kinase
MPLGPGSRLDAYEIVALLGRGSMSALWLARDSRLDRLVALKLFMGVSDPEARKRFRQERRVVLRHKNIVEIFEAGEHEGVPFIAMEYLEGETLRSLIARRAPLPLVQKLQLMEQLCDGLAFAHANGRIHQNITPGELLVENRTGRLKILDFGMANVAGLIGNPSYSSPEQLQEPLKQDHRSDIFSVGVVFYELLSYRMAFPGDGFLALFHQICVGPPAPLCDLIGHLDGEIERIVYRALEKAPADRFQDLAVMRREIAQVRQRL